MTETLATTCDTSVSFCDLDSDIDISIAQAVSCLSPDEVERMNRFVFRRDQLRFARGRGFLRQALGKHLNRAPSSIFMSYGPNGKPYVLSSGIDFNLSHSSHKAVLAICKSGLIGIDIEACDRLIDCDADLADLGKRCFTPLEQDCLMQCSGEARQKRFLQYWTAKEARMKVRGQGIKLDPKQIELRLVDGQPVGYKNHPDLSLTVIRSEEPKFVCCYASASENIGEAL